MDKKILIIDDNKMLSKLLAKKIKITLGCDVDIAFSLAEASNLNDEYLLAFVDLCLPDAPNGEAVSFTIEKKIPTIVLTANNDKKLKDEFMSKDIIDYIFKEDADCIELMLDSILKLKHYAKMKVILAMPKIAERNELKKYLNLRFFNVLAAAHGEEAMNYLNDNKDTKLIIADANMPVLSGAELLAQVRDEFSEVSVILLGDKNDGLEAELIKAGVDDYLIKPFSKELFYAKLDRSLEKAESKLFLNEFKGIDLVSNLKAHNALNASIYDYFNEISSEENFAFAFLNIDNLSVINEEYGYNTGDEIIKICAKEMKNEIKGRDIIGRWDKDKFCIILKNVAQEKAIKIFSHIRVNIKKAGILINLDEIFFTISIGIAFGIKDDKLEDLAQKASTALTHAKTGGKDRVEVCS